MKATKLKTWPELVDYIPALTALTDNRRSLRSETQVELDLEPLRAVTSAGLTIFLLQLLRFLRNTHSLKLRHNASLALQNKLDFLGFSTILSPHISDYRESPTLFDDTTPIVSRKDSPDNVTSLPIYPLAFTRTQNRRQPIQAFIKSLTLTMHKIDGLDQTQVNGIVMLLNEIAKNSADHSTSDAYFGLDIHHLENGRGKIVFVFGDLGIGIKSHIESNLSSEHLKRLKHMSLYEAYRLALKPGYTSNPHGLNKGHGMSIITDCADTLGLHLSVFDAWSRGLLSALSTIQSYSHSEIRRAFMTVGHDVGFFYYGEMTIGDKTR